MLRASPGPTLILLLIQQGLGFAAYLALAVVTVILFVPAIVVLIATDAGAPGIVVAAVTAVVAIPAAGAVAGAIGTFSHGLWTLGYLRMTRSRETPSPA